MFRETSSARGRFEASTKSLGSSETDVTTSNGSIFLLMLMLILRVSLIRRARTTAKVIVK